MGTDYALSHDTLTLDFNNHMQTVRVSAVEDSIVEKTESFTLSLSSTDRVILDDPVNVSIEDNTGQFLHNGYGSHVL